MESTYKSKQTSRQASRQALEVHSVGAMPWRGLFLMFICDFCVLYKDKLVLREVTNHPVHMKNGKGRLSPSSFIPFCSFGQNMSIMGTHIDDFDVPVCNSFESVVHNGQLCYQVDLEKFKDEDTLERQLQFGLVIILDENEDRQFIANKNKLTERLRDVFSSDQEDDFQIHLTTLSKYHTDKSQGHLILNYNSLLELLYISCQISLCNMNYKTLTFVN